jgi:hypothetical protein
MAFSRIGYESFRLRQLTGIPLLRISEVASEIAYKALIENPDLLRETIEKYSIRSPSEQLEIDLKRGYEKVVDIGEDNSVREPMLLDYGKVLDILCEHEAQAIDDIKTDRAINADSYESVGRYKLIQKIKKRVNNIHR